MGEDTCCRAIAHNLQRLAHASTNPACPTQRVSNAVTTRSSENSRGPDVRNPAAHPRNLPPANPPQHPDHRGDLRRPGHAVVEQRRAAVWHTGRRHLQLEPRWGYRRISADCGPGARTAVATTIYG